jgi:DNA-binding LacI/PurR family transcriptional regulator
VTLSDLQNHFSASHAAMKPHVTLRDIAEKLSVSLMSVSMALHNNPKISAKRRLQVQEEARRMGYNPNAMAVALDVTSFI